jgi:hypothetical protein
MRRDREPLRDIRSLTLVPHIMKMLMTDATWENHDTGTVSSGRTRASHTKTDQALEDATPLLIH